MAVMFTIHYGVYAPLNIFCYLKIKDYNYDNPEHMWPTAVPRGIS